MPVSLADLEALSNAAARVDTSPIGLAGRLLGLSGAEQRAGVPPLGWVALAAGVGLLGGIWLERTKKLPTFGGSR